MFYSKLTMTYIYLKNIAQLWFSRLESWSRDVSRLVFQSLGLGLGLETQSLGLGLGLEDLSLGLFVFLPTV